LYFYRILPRPFADDYLYYKTFKTSRPEELDMDKVFEKANLLAREG
jgi:hypothetical protein